MDIRNRISQIENELKNLQTRLQQTQQQEQQLLRDIIAKQGALQELQDLVSKDIKKN